VDASKVMERAVTLIAEKDWSDIIKKMRVSFYLILKFCI